MIRDRSVEMLGESFCVSEAGERGRLFVSFTGYDGCCCCTPAQARDAAGALLAAASEAEAEFVAQEAP